MKKTKQANPTSLFGLRWGHGKIVGYFLLGMLVGIMTLVAVARLTYHTKFYPRIEVAGVSVAGLTREQARVRILEATQNYQAKLVFNGSSWETPKESVNFEVDDTLNEAYHYGRRVQIEDYLLLLINKKTSYPLKIAEGKTEKMEGLINEISLAIEIVPVEPTIEIVGQKVRVTNGSDGVVLDSEMFDQEIRSVYSKLGSEDIAVPTKIAERRLTSEKLSELTARAETLAQVSMVMTLDDEKISLGGKELIPFLSTEGGIEEVDMAIVNGYVVGLGDSLNKESQDAKFEFIGGKVKEFAPGRDGITVGDQETAVRIQTGIKNLLEGKSKSETIEVAATRTPPKVTTEKVNELGIRERIGRGESYYQHSIPNRIYNVALASSRINSTLFAPGEEVSFNKMVGEVSSATGYRPAYIISAGRTVLGDGGGLCQVSTTMFRAVISAGLPIIERWGHAYRVSYYELDSKPGVDATVIAPSKDFRFKNDTPGHILIQTINDPKALHLVIEIYGTSDGRVATIENHKVWGITPPLPTIYQDDPSLPAGTTKQIDWAAAGAKASFEYKVVRDGETIQDKTFSTTYRPWASVFLRGTGAQ
ncbi:MAG: VanW family protein [bacterium]